MFEEVSLPSRIWVHTLIFLIGFFLIGRRFGVDGGGKENGEEKEKRFRRISYHYQDEENQKNQKIRRKGKHISGTLQ